MGLTFLAFRQLSEKAETMARMEGILSCSRGACSITLVSYISLNLIYFRWDIYVFTDWLLIGRNRVNQDVLVRLLCLMEQFVCSVVMSLKLTSGLGVTMHEGTHSFPGAARAISWSGSSMPWAAWFRNSFCRLSFSLGDLSMSAVMVWMRPISSMVVLFELGQLRSMTTFASNGPWSEDVKGSVFVITIYRDKWTVIEAKRSPCLGSIFGGRTMIDGGNVGSGIST